MFKMYKFIGRKDCRWFFFELLGSEIGVIILFFFI